jgi:membrane protease YdiL (CAAX protease family)
MKRMRPPPDSGRLRRFLLVAFGWSWPLQLLSLRLPPALRKIVLGVGMWGPALGAMAANEGPWRDALRRLYRPPGLRGGHTRVAALAAMVIPPAATLLAIALAIRLGWARLNPAHPRPGTLAVIVVAGTLVSPLLNFPVALGEELGWRGFLFPTLSASMEGTDRRAAMILTGVIWGVWHAPLVIAGFNYPGHPWLAVPLMVGLATVLNLLFVTLAGLGGTMTAPTLAHGSINGTGGLATLLLIGGDSAITPPAGVLAWVPLALGTVALILYARR